jgi:hypothetical protein
MAGHPSEFDTKRSIREAGADEHSRQLVDYSMPRAGREAATLNLAFRKPLTAATWTSRFLKRTALDRKRICHGKSVVQMPAHAQKRFPASSSGKLFSRVGD